MTVTSLAHTPTQALAARANKEEKPATEAPKTQEDGQTPPPDTMAQQIVDSLVSSPEFTKKALTKLGKGDELTIVVNDAEVIKVRNEGPGFTQKLISGTQNVITAASNEAARIVQADPAFAFKEAAMGVRTQVANGIPRQASDVIENAFLPMLRTVALVLDSKKAIDTFRNKDASTVDKIVDGVHVATDVAGLVGALGYNMVPALSGLAGPLTAVGLVGDIAAYSYHVLQYLRERGQVNFNEGQQQQQPPQQTPPPAPNNPTTLIAA